MQEKHHVKTVPGEPKAPEVLKDGTVGEAIRVDESGHAQADDIDVAQVAVIVAFCVALLVVIILVLQGAFYRLDEAEIARKQAPQGAPGTELGAMINQHATQLGAGQENKAWWINEPKRQIGINIDRAIKLTVADYAPGGAKRK